MKAVWFAVIYGIFAGLFITVNIEILDIPRASQMYEAVSFKFERMPWNLEPVKTIDDIQTPLDIYDWMRTVFVPVLFNEKPAVGDTNGWCTDRTPGMAYEGDCDESSQCGGVPVQCGDKTAGQSKVRVNGRLWETQNLESWCEFQGKQVNTSIVDQGCTLDACCSDPYNDLKPIEKLELLTFNDIKIANNCPSFMDSALDCCEAQFGVPFDTLKMAYPVPTDPNVISDWDDQSKSWDQVTSQQDADLWSANYTFEQRKANKLHTVLGDFNRVLMVRLSLKRYAMSENPSPLEKFRDTYPWKMLSGRTPISPIQDQEGLEMMKDFKGSKTGTTYKWQKKRGFQGSGGYIEYLDPDWDIEEVRKRITFLFMDGWFDMKMACLVVDMMLFNGNVDKFMQLAFVFSFDFSGLATRATVANTFNMNLYNFANPGYMNRAIMEVVILAMIMYFFSLEVNKICEKGLSLYFSLLTSWVDFISLSISATVILSGWLLVADPIFAGFEFPMAEEWEDRRMVMDDLQELALTQLNSNRIIAFNLLIVFFRMIMLLNEINHSYGLLLNTMGTAFGNLMSFLLMFCVLFVGFASFAHFNFGTSYVAMNTIIGSLLECFLMLIGSSDYSALKEADSMMAPIFFYTFYVFFFFILLNMFISILLSAYDVEMFQLEQSEPEDNPIKQVVDSILSELNKRFKFLFENEVVSALMKMVPSSDSVDDADNEDVGKGKRTRKSDALMELASCTVMIFFMLNFVLFVLLQGRGEESYSLSASSTRAAETVQWIDYPPLRIMSYEEIQSFDDIYMWAMSAIVGDLYEGSVCVDGKGGEIPASLCNNKNNGMQLVPQVMNWNVGFQNTTFVRLTVQHACFDDNTDARWAQGYRYLRQTNGMVNCANYPCAATNPTGSGCKNFMGKQIDASKFIGDWSDLSYNYTGEQRLGPYRNQGGFAVSLGVNADSARDKLVALRNDGLFGQDSVSMVFDWVTYSGNTDMFTYTEVKFSLMDTGKINRGIRSQSMPMNIFGFGGYYSFQRFLITVNFIIYACLVLMYALLLLRDLKDQRGISKRAGRPFYGFIVDFYLGTLFNISDTISMTLSILALTNFYSYMSIHFLINYKFSIDAETRFVIPNADEKVWFTAKTVDPTRYQEEDWYIFMQFEQMEASYAGFLQIAGLNTFFIAIKVVKYVQRIPAVNVMSGTLDRVRGLIGMFTTIICLLLVGFAFMYHVEFGVLIPSFASPASSFLSLFLFMLGDIPDLSGMLNASPITFYPLFAIFMFLFYFIFVNMYLATMMSKYADTVSRLEVQRKEEQFIHAQKERMVKYASKKDAEADGIEFSKPGNGSQFFVKSVLGDSQAAKEHIEPGDELEKLEAMDPEAGPTSKDKKKVYEDKTEFRKMSVENVFSQLPDVGEVHLLFKVHKDKSMMSVFGHHEDQDTGEAKLNGNFWRQHGVLTWSWRRQADVLLNPQDNESEDGEEFSDDEEGGEEEEEQSEEDKGGDEGDAPDRDMNTEEFIERVRQKTTSAMQALLFSRSSATGGRGSKAMSQDPEAVVARVCGAADGAEDFGEDGGSQQTEHDVTRDYLNHWLENVPVQGEEAWLDCLITAIEQEPGGNSVVADLLRTSDMTDPGGTGKGPDGQRQRVLKNFNKQADLILKVLETKARTKYFFQLERESLEKQELLKQQNGILNEYVLELEAKFESIMMNIHNLKRRKGAMLGRLAGAADPERYGHLAGNGTQNGHS